AQRQVKAALPTLLKILREPEPPVVRVAALNALRSLAGISEITPLVQALANAKEPAELKAAESALVTVCGRCGPKAAEPVLKALAGAPEGSEAPLLRALARGGGQQALDAVIQRLEDPRAPIRQEALKLLTVWRERTAVPPLLAVAEKPRDDREGILAIRALVRLAGPRKDEWGTDIKLLTKAMGLSKRPDEKRLALGVLGSVATRETLILAARALTDPALSKEAATATVTIAEKLPRPGAGDIRAAMEKVLASTQDAKLRARAEKVLVKHRASLAATAKKLAGKLPTKAPATPAKPRRLLIFDVNVGYGGHPSRFAANDAFTLMGTATGAYETVLSRDPQVFRPESLKQFDAVFLNNAVGLPFEDPALQQSLVEFVYGGGGLLGTHGSIFTFIDWGGKRGDTWPEFATMLGARGGTHASQREHVFVKLDDPTSPVNTVFGGQDFEYRDEFFRVSKPYSRDRVRVLMSIDGQKTDLASHKLPDALKKKDGDYPLAWVRHYGRGRVFYSTIGHNSFVFEDKNMLEFYLAAVQFALGDLPTPTIPSGRLSPAIQAWEKLGWRLGMTTYSLHKHTFFEAMEKTQKLGLPYINGLCFQKVSKEIPKNFGPSLTDAEIKQIRLKLDATHTRLLTHYIGDIPGDEAGCRKAFEFARKMGIETLIAEPKLAALDTIEKFCDEYDIKVGLHNHGEKQSPNYWHPKRIMEVCKGRSKRIGACADIGYWMRAGIDPIEGIKTLGDRLITIQMHDLDALTPEGHDVPWGTGAGKTREVLQTIRELGLKPTMFGLEYSLDFLDNMPQMGQCAAFFNTVAIGLAK
ncbi:MAG: TIM barrel protein, partial [Victivallales bacterium]|nr:TIM barrel protein [Victivallales bacterium]